MGKLRGKSAGATLQAMGNTQPKNAGMPILKQYKIHVRNAQDGYAYDGLQCYSGKENFKTHTGVDFGGPCNHTPAAVPRV